MQRIEVTSSVGNGSFERIPPVAGRRRLAGVLLALVSCLVGCEPSRVSRVQQYELGIPEIESRSGENGLRLRMAGFEVFGESGDPRLLRRVYRLVLPPGVDPDSVRVEVEEVKERSIEQVDRLAAVESHSEQDERGEVQRVARTDGKKLQKGRNPEVFGRDRLYPESILGPVALSKFRGWNILHVPVVPVRYNDEQRLLSVVDELRIRVEFTQTEEETEQIFLDEDLLDLIRFEGVQEGLDLVREYDVTPEELGECGVDYLIVTAEAIEEEQEENGLADFVAHKTRVGLGVQVATVEEIEKLYSTGDRARKIRHYIQDQYESNGIRYVLLVGNPDGEADSSEALFPDEGVVPMRVTSTGDGEIPTDMYYTELDADWDRDDDGKYSESWSETGYPDLMVGRVAPVGGYIDDIYQTACNITEEIPRQEKLRTVFEKMIRYDTELDKSWRYKMLGFASWMFGSEDENGASSLQSAIDEIEEDDPSFSSYTVFQDATPWGIDDEFFDGVSDPEASASLYGSDSFSISGDKLSNAYVVWSLNGPYGIVGWVGHGSWTGVTVGGGDTSDGNALSRTWLYYPDSLTAGLEIDDEKPSVVYSTSCHNMKTGTGSALEGDVEAQLQKWSNLAVSLQYRGAICVVASTDYQWMGLGEDPVFGKAAWYQKQFLINVAGGQSFGRAFRSMKQRVQFYYRAWPFGDTEYRNHLQRTWNGVNLLGDPSQELFFDTSEIADDEFDEETGNDAISKATVLYQARVSPSGSITINVEGAVAKDADWYVLKNLGPILKRIRVTLIRNQRLGELDLAVYDENLNRITGVSQQGENTRSVYSIALSSSETYYIKVNPESHINDYDLRVEVGNLSMKRR